jgi:hypothetical protein
MRMIEFMNCERKTESRDSIVNRRRKVDCRFKPITGVKYCKGCGSGFKIESNIDVSNNDVCSVCGCDEFVEGKIAEVITGYITLGNRNALKLYAKTMRCISGFRGKRKMSKLTNKHVAFLLLCDDGFFKLTDKESFKWVESVFWRI